MIIKKIIITALLVCSVSLTNCVNCVFADDNNPLPISKWDFENDAAIADSINGFEWNNAVISDNIEKDIPGKVNMAYRFNRNSDTSGGISLGELPSSICSTTATNISISAWVKQEYSTYTQTIFQIIGTDNNNTDCSLTASMVGNQLQVFNGKNGINNTTLPTIQQNEWFHLCITLEMNAAVSSLTNQNLCIVYINGEEVSRRSFARSSGFCKGIKNAEMYIGCQNGNTNAFNGIIDEIELYNSILNANTVNSMYNNYSSSEIIGEDLQLITDGENNFTDNSVSITANNEVNIPTASFEQNATVNGKFRYNNYLMISNMPSDIYVDKVEVLDNTIKISFSGNTNYIGLVNILLLSDAVDAGNSNSNTLNTSIMCSKDIEIYVSPNGNDLNTGTQDDPLATIETAKQRVRTLMPYMQGDIYVNLCEGTYFIDNPINFSYQDSGANGYNVVYQSKKGEKAILSGGRNISNWTLYDSEKNIWMASANGASGRQFYVNGERKKRASANDTQLIEITPVEGEQYAIAKDIFFSDYGNLSDIEIVWKQSFSDYHMCIQKIEDDRIYFPQTFAQYQPSGSVISIENAFEFLDEEGEWYIDKSTDIVYYKPGINENIENSECVLSSSENLINISGTEDEYVHNIVFNNLNFEYTTWNGPNNSAYGFPNFQAGIARDNTSGWNSNMVKAAVEGNYCNDIRFYENTFTHLGGAGIWLVRGNSATSVCDNEFNDISHTAIMLSHPQEAQTKQETKQVRNGVVKNNKIHDVGIEYLGSVGICVFYANNIELSQNEIYNIPYSGISMGWGWRNQWKGWIEGNKPFTGENKILRNHIYNVMNRLNDGGGIYAFGIQPNLQIRGNCIHDLNAAFASAIYLDNGSMFMNVTNNVAYNSPCLLYAKGCNNTIIDNYFDDNYLTKFSFEQCNGKSELSNFTDLGGVGEENIINNFVVQNGEYPQEIVNNAGLYSGALFQNLVTKNNDSIHGTIENISGDNMKDVNIYAAVFDGNSLLNVKELYNDDMLYNDVINIDYKPNIDGNIKMFVWQDMRPLTNSGLNN